MFFYVCPMPRCCCCDEQSEEEEFKFTDDHSTSEELKFTDDHSTSCARAYKRLTFVDVRTNLPITCVYNVSLWSPRKPDGEWVGGGRCGLTNGGKRLLWIVGENTIFVTIFPQFPGFG